MTVVVLVRFMLAPQVIVVEQAGPLRAMLWSWRLVRGLRRYLKVLLIIAALAVLPFLVGVPLSDLQRDAVLGANGGRTAGILPWFIVSHVGSALAAGLLIPSSRSL